MKALSKQPQDRYPSAQAFVQALEQASQDLLPTERMRPIISSSLPLANASITTPYSSIVQASPSHQPATPSQTPPPPINPSAPLSSTSTPPLQQPPVLALPASQTTTPPLTPTPRTRPPSSLPTPVTPIPSTQPPSPSPEKTTNTSKISRRAVLIGAAGIIVVAGTSVFFIPHQPTLEPTPTPTSVPQGQLFFTYQGHSSWVNAVAWSPDGQRIASGSWDNTVRVWQAV